MLLYLVRHGATAYTEENRYTGSNDPPLLPESVLQAKKLVRYFHNEVPRIIYTSPLRRTLETATALKEALPHTPPLLIEPLLREIHYGAWEGRTRAEILAENPRAFETWDRDPFQGGPPGGEPVPSVVQRLETFWNRVELHGAPLLLVSHRTVLRLFACMLLKIPLNEYRQRIDFLPVHLTLFELKGRWEGKLLHHNLPP